MLPALRLYFLGLQALPRINIKRLVIMHHAAILRLLRVLEWLHESLHGYLCDRLHACCLFSLLG